MKRLFVYSIGAALCAFALSGCLALPLIAAQSASAWVPAAAVGGAVVASNASTKHYEDQSGRNTDVATYDLANPITSAAFKEGVKRAATTLNYRVNDGNAASDEVMFLSRNQGGSKGVLGGFGYKPPTYIGLMVRLTSGKRVTVSEEVNGGNTNRDTKGDIDAFWKAFQGDQAPVVAAK